MDNEVECLVDASVCLCKDSFIRDKYERFANFLNGHSVGVVHAALIEMVSAFCVAHLGSRDEFEDFIEKIKKNVSARQGIEKAKEKAMAEWEEEECQKS